MNSVTYLKQLFFTLLFISVLSIPVIAFLIYCNIQLSDLISSLFNTSIATLYAITLAIFIYWRQQKDKYEALLSSLRNYTNYLIDNLPEITYSMSDSLDELVEVPVNLISVNKTIINSIIESGYFNDLLQELVKLQNGIEFYHFSIELYFTMEHSSIEELRSKLDMIKSTQDIIQDESENILNKLKAK